MLQGYHVQVWSESVTSDSSSKHTRLYKEKIGHVFSLQLIENTVI